MGERSDVLRKTSLVSLDIVIPMFNETSVLDPLLSSLHSVFGSQEQRHTLGLTGVRFIMVDDGSTDETAQRVMAYVRKGQPITLVRLSRNFGHQGAIEAGLSLADADLVAVMDADLQDPPELIPEMVALWRCGYDVVYGVRRSRRESWLKRSCYWAFYRLVSMLSDVSIPVDSGDFSLMDRRVILALSRLPETLRFQRGLRAWVGFHQTGLEYARPSRTKGKTKYTIRMLYQLATDGIASMSTRPLKAAQLACFLFVAGSLAQGVFLANAIGSGSHGASRAVLFVGFLVTVGNAVQAFCFYLLGAYIGRTYLEAKSRPGFVVMEVAGQVGKVAVQPDDDVGSLVRPVKVVLD